MKFNNLIIYYLSGTGNALKASEWLIEKASECGMKTSIHSIDRFKDMVLRETNDKTLFAFCYPTHGFNPAPLMLKFMFKFPRGKADVVFVNTRGGLKFKKMYFPGLSGLAQILPMAILKIKGYKIAGSLPFDLPSNWISLHPGLTNNAVNDIVNRRRGQMKNFAGRLFKNGKAYNYKFFLYMPLDIAVIPIAAGYYFFFRFVLAKSFYATSDCNDCRICVKNCPTESIKIVGSRPYWKYTCESCMRCISTCPKKSIQTAHSFIIPMLYFLSVLPVAAAIYNAFNINIGHGVLNYAITKMLNWIFTLTAVFAAYLIFSFLLKLKPINKFFEYTSLTRYWRRYLFPGTKIKNL
ncbi:MAG: EFR1 family ferrodoxin [Ignavibacteria bacterium]|nr:EFR1 family ferrodoxin [Ignavibacteria bacterium]